MRPAGPLARLMLAVATAAVARAAAAGEAAPVALVSGRVTVEFVECDRELASSVPRTVARAGEELSRRVGLGLPERIRVRLLRVPEAFATGPGGPVELYAGVAYPASGTVHVNMSAVDGAGPMARAAFARTLRHELVHLALGRHPAGGVPKWFEEGLACAFGSPFAADLPAGSAGEAPALASLETSFPRGGEAMLLAYAKSESVVRFLVRTRSEAAVRAVLARLAAGADFDLALREATGFDTAGLESAWRASLGPWWGARLLERLFSPAALFVWTAVAAAVAHVVVRRRRTKAMASMPDAP